MRIHTSASKLSLVSFLALASVGILGAGCGKSSPDPATSASTTSASTTNATPNSNALPTPAVDTSAVSSLGAPVGQAAPDFTLSDLDGKSVSLHDFKGKTVVLEWFNPHCPFVNAAHTNGSLKETASKDMANGVVWLSINSGAAGKEGAGVAASKEGVAKFSMKNPVLLDTDGKVGHLYGATNTPHMFVIGPDGVLAYKGAIDNSPDGEGGAVPKGSSLVNYVDAAISSINAKTPVSVKETKAYGCGVKYGS